MLSPKLQGITRFSGEEGGESFGNQKKQGKKHTGEENNGNQGNEK